MQHACQGTCLLTELASDICDISIFASCLQEEEEIRPASPKYDERSFFYTTPKLNPARPLLQRPLATQGASGLAAHPASAAETVPRTLQTPAAAVPPSPQWADR